MLDIEVKDELVEIITQIRLGAYGDDDNSIFFHNPLPPVFWWVVLRYTLIIQAGNPQKETWQRTFS